MKLVFKALEVCKFFIKRADLPAAFSLEQRDQWKSCQMQEHILNFRWLEFSVWWLTLTSKPSPRWRALKWNLIQSVRKFDSNFLLLIKVPTLPRGPPPPTPSGITLIGALRTDKRNKRQETKQLQIKRLIPSDQKYKAFRYLQIDPLFFVLHQIFGMSNLWQHPSSIFQTSSSSRYRPRNFPFRKQAMPFSQHLENFSTNFSLLN